MFRLRTGHNRLNYHLCSKLRTGHTEQCPCGTGSQTKENLLQSCPIYEPLRKGIWPDQTPVARKLYGSLRDLACDALPPSLRRLEFPIWRTRRRFSTNQPTNKRTMKQADKQTNKEASKQTNKQKNQPTNKSANKPAERANKQACKQASKQTPTN